MHINYKVARCKKWDAQQQWCQFGRNCNFAHGDGDLRPGPTPGPTPVSVPPEEPSGPGLESSSNSRLEAWVSGAQNGIDPLTPRAFVTDRGPPSHTSDFRFAEPMQETENSTTYGAIGPDLNHVGFLMVQDRMVGLIIGQGGEQIIRLEAESGCRIQMAQDSRGLAERQCTLNGPHTAILQARAAIDRIIACTFEMSVPGYKVGWIIGQGGETIKRLQHLSGAKIVIIQDSAEAAHEKPLRITGDPNAIETAKELVQEILNRNDDRDMGGLLGEYRYPPQGYSGYSGYSEYSGYSGNPDGPQQGPPLPRQRAFPPAMATRPAPRPLMAEAGPPSGPQMVPAGPPGPMGPPHSAQSGPFNGLNGPTSTIFWDQWTPSGTPRTF